MGADAGTPPAWPRRPSHRRGNATSRTKYPLGAHELAEVFSAARGPATTRDFNGILKSILKLMPEERGRQYGAVFFSAFSPTISDA
jgi:hypothetical protein